jgi:hypothetical protein
MSKQKLIFVGVNPDNHERVMKELNDMMISQ